MRTAAILSALAAIGCSAPEPQTAVAPQAGGVPQAVVPVAPQQDQPYEVRRVRLPEANPYEARTREDCLRYSGRPEFFGFCLYQVAQRGEGDLGVEHLCEGSASWEIECRDAWTIARARPDTHWTIDVLLSACGTIDCRFEVLDFRPNPSIASQVVLCAEHADRFGGDCAAHGMDRWLRGAPTEQEFSSLRELDLFPDRIGHYMGLSVSCYNVGECGDRTEADERCSLTVTEIAENPELCRAMRESSQ